jgi:hypothetical protein
LGLPVLHYVSHHDVAVMIVRWITSVVRTVASKHEAFDHEKLAVAGSRRNKHAISAANRMNTRSIASMIMVSDKYYAYLLRFFFVNLIFCVIQKLCHGELCTGTS